MNVENVYRIQKTSKAGKPYQTLVIKFSNGYELETFLSNEQQYILKDVELINK